MYAHASMLGYVGSNRQISQNCKFNFCPYEEYSYITATSFVSSLETWPLDLSLTLVLLSAYVILREFDRALLYRQPLRRLTISLLR